VLTQAPTGTTSLLAGVSSGIEPVYEFAFIRKDRIGEHEVYHPIYKEWVDTHPGQTVPEYFCSAKELLPEDHVRMQAVIQEYTDSSISKTVNAPNNHTMEQVKTLYTMAYDLGCKGVTYFRDGSRDVAVLYSMKDKDKNKAMEKQKEATGGMDAQPASESKTGNDVSFVVPPSFHPEPRPRPNVTSGKTYKTKTGYGTLFVTVNDDEQGKPFEVFATIGKTGGFFAAKSEAICRLISLALRSRIEPRLVIDQIKGIRGPMPAWTENGQILSIPDAIAKVMEIHMNSGQQQLSLAPKADSVAQPLPALTPLATLNEGKIPEAVMASVMSHDGKVHAEVKSSVADRGFAPECPECGNIMQLSEGCMLCQGCGFSKCG
jgi:ribonucleoside-diphosphate reductase alpha chain